MNLLYFTDLTRMAKVAYNGGTTLWLQLSTVRGMNWCGLSRCSLTVFLRYHFDSKR